MLQLIVKSEEIKCYLSSSIFNKCHDVIYCTQWVEIKYEMNEANIWDLVFEDQVQSNNLFSNILLKFYCL